MNFRIINKMSYIEQPTTSRNDKSIEATKKYTSSYLNSITWLEWNNIMAKELNDAGFKRSRWDSSKGCYESVHFVTSSENPHSFILGEVSKYEEIEYLKNKQLLNNGRCPKCGNPIIGNPCRFTSGNDNRINYHICQSCAKNHGTIDFNLSESIKTDSQNFVVTQSKKNDFDNTKPSLPNRANKAKKWVLLFVLSCLVIGILCIIASLLKKHSIPTNNEPTTLTYIFNEAFELKMRSDWDFDKMSCPHYIMSSKDNDTIKYNADFKKGQLILVPKGHNIIDTLSAAIYIEYRKVDTKTIDLAHHYQQHQNANQLKRYVEKSLKENVESNGTVRNGVKYNYVNLNGNKGFSYSCNLIDKDNLQTFNYSNYTFWNYDELITITVIYDNIDSEKWEKQCSYIVNNFNWVNPK